MHTEHYYGKVVLDKMSNEDNDKKANKTLNHTPYASVSCERRREFFCFDIICSTHAFVHMKHTARGE